ncbi:glycosyltransferase [Variovorax sp. 2RAF20]
MTRQTKVLLLGFTIPEEVARQLFELDPFPAVQTHKFAWSLARALKIGFNELKLASACPVQSYPLVKKIIFRGRAFQFEGFEGTLLGFLNILAIKHFTRFMACLINVLPLIWRGRTDWIVVHGIHSPFLLFGNLARLLGCKFAVVLTDPPGVILGTDRLITRYLKQIDAWLLGRLLRRANAVIALAPDLANQLAPKKPALIFPGILNSRFSSLLNESSVEKQEQKLPDAERPFVFLYAGGLHAAYGVDRLIDAVAGLEHHLVQLRLFGRGDQEDRIRKLARTDPRFFYGGFVGAEELLPELRAADLLVNPRPTTEKFSQMSFPSKLIEYLAIGRPVLTTRIKSIPIAFGDCFLFIEDESSEGIRAALMHAIHMTPADRERVSAFGCDFVKTEVSENAIGRKIANFIQSVDSSH